MRSTRRILPAIVCLALAIGVLTMAPSAGAVVGQEPAGRASASPCARATERLAEVKQLKQKRADHKAKAKRRLARAKRAHRPQQIREARAAVQRWTRLHHRSVVAVRRQKAQKATACRPAPAVSQKTLKAVGAGSLLGLLSAASNDGTVPQLDVDQLTGLLDTLYPGASDLLSPERLTQMLAGFNVVADLSRQQLGALFDLIGGADALDPSKLFDLLAGGAIGSGQLTALVSTVTDLLGSLAGQAGGAISSPQNPLASISGLFTALFGGITSVPTETLGSLLGLLTAAAGHGALPDLDLADFTSLLDDLFPGASALFDPSGLTSMFTAFSGADGLGLSQLNDLIGTLTGSGAGLSPLQLISMLSGSPLGVGQLSSLTNVVTGLLSGLSGSAFEAPTNPLGLLGDLLDDLLGGIICGLLGC